jgi:hypothetical protein
VRWLEPRTLDASGAALAVAPDEALHRVAQVELWHHSRRRWSTKALSAGETCERLGK